MKAISILLLAIGLSLHVSGQGTDSTTQTNLEMTVTVETGVDASVDAATDATVNKIMETTMETTTDEIRTAEEEEEPEMKPFGECPEASDEFPTYLSDVKNCSVFYQCTNGVPYRMQCRFPLEFNPVLNVCDYPSASGCLF